MLPETQFARIKLFSYKAILMNKKPEKFVWLAATRVVIPKVGMGVEFLDIDADSNATLLAWIENLRKSC